MVEARAALQEARASPVVRRALPYPTIGSPWRTGPCMVRAISG